MKASALVVGPRDSVGAGLVDVARSLGFAPVVRYAGMTKAAQQADTTPLIFFLFAPVKDVRTLKPTADLIRFSPDDRLRFLPLIYFSPQPSADCIRACIEMGFDDVIAIPYIAGDLRERINRQVGRAQTYYETATYFGPDRRNRIGAPRSPESDHGGGQHRRIEIVRTEAGIDLLRDDLQVVL